MLIGKQQTIRAALVKAYPEPEPEVRGRRASAAVSRWDGRDAAPLSSSLPAFAEQAQLIASI